MRNSRCSTIKTPHFAIPTTGQPSRRSVVMFNFNSSPERISAMPLNHNRATATLSVTGLALGCLNPATRNWEVAIIRAPGHVLRITVNKVAADGSSSDVTFEIDNNHRVFITAANAVVPENQLFMAEHFDRLNPGQSDL